ncbi:hypothetical protein CLAIMM_00352, partial [Cladophialophora immunda]
MSFSVIWGPPIARRRKDIRTVPRTERVEATRNIQKFSLGRGGASSRPKKNWPRRLSGPSSRYESTSRAWRQRRPRLAGLERTPAALVSVFVQARKIDQIGGSVPSELHSLPRPARRRLKRQSHLFRAMASLARLTKSVRDGRDLKSPPTSK